MPRNTFKTSLKNISLPKRFLSSVRMDGGQSFCSWWGALVPLCSPPCKESKKKKKDREWGDGGCRWHRGNYILIPAAEDLNCDTLFSSTWKGTCPLFFFPFAPAKSRRRHSVKERSDMQLITFSWSPSTTPTSPSTPPLTPLPFAFRPSVVTDFTMTW